MESKIERINLINGLTFHLMNLDPILATVVMKEHGWERYGFLDWDETNNSYTIAEFLMKCSDDVLVEINEYFRTIGAPSSSVSDADAPKEETSTFKLFLSHKSEHKSIAVDLKYALGFEGIEGFVAHQDIQDNSLWRESIKGQLKECHAFAIILTEGIDKSVWCQQEVGWALSRQIPTIPINFIPNPPNFGFLSDFQYIQYGTNDLAAVANRISNLLLNNPSTNVRLRARKFELFRDSWNYDRTRLLWKTISSFTSLTSSEVQILERAMLENSQIRECSIDRKMPGEVIREFIRTQSKTA